MIAPQIVCLHTLSASGSDVHNTTCTPRLSTKCSKLKHPTIEHIRNRKQNLMSARVQPYTGMQICHMLQSRLGVQSWVGALNIQT